MKLKELTFPQNLKILRETHDIWSAGLSHGLYREYQWRQKCEPWGRRAIRHLAIEEGGEPLASCKCYDIEISSRGRIYNFYGIGAIFTRPAFRGRGFGGALLEEVIGRAEAEGRDGLILFSDIDNYYEHHGFHALSSIDFYFSVNAPSAASTVESPKYKVESLGFAHIDTLERYHRRWQARRPFGLVRTASMWHYKIAKENFLHQNSRASWPGLNVLFVENTPGYCIFESAARTLRILEMAHGPESSEKFWLALFAEARRTGIKRIRGWEGNVCDLSPGFDPTQLDLNCDNSGHLHYQERNWGRIMMHLINDDIDYWLHQFPCPLTELDHL